MTVVFSRIAFVWETAYYFHLVSDNKAFVVCIDACTYPNHYPVVLVFDILIQFCRSFHSGRLANRITVSTSCMIEIQR